MSCMLCRSTSLSGALLGFDRRRGWPLQRISVTKGVETHRLAAMTLVVHDEVRYYLQKTCKDWDSAKGHLKKQCSFEVQVEA